MNGTCRDSSSGIGGRFACVLREDLVPEVGPRSVEDHGAELRRFLAEEFPQGGGEPVERPVRQAVGARQPRQAKKERNSRLLPSTSNNLVSVVVGIRGRPVRDSTDGAGGATPSGGRSGGAGVAARAASRSRSLHRIEPDGAGVSFFRAPGGGSGAAAALREGLSGPGLTVERCGRRPAGACSPKCGSTRWKRSDVGRQEVQGDGPARQPPDEHGQHHAEDAEHGPRGMERGSDGGFHVFARGP